MTAATAERWSIYGAQRAQPLAIGGKWDALENRLNWPMATGGNPRQPFRKRTVRRGLRFESTEQHRTRTR